MVGAAGLVVLLAALAFLQTRHTAAAAAPSADHVVIFGVPGLQLDDLSAGRMPTLSRLAARGALGELAADTRSKRPTSAELYASLGASARAEPAGASARAQSRTPSGEGSGSAPDSATTACGPTDVIVPDARATAARSRDLHTGSHPGALGDAVAVAGRQAGVVGASDSARLDGRPILSRPAALAVMTSGGCVARGTVDAATLLREDRTAPAGRAVDGEVFASVTAQTVSASAVTVVDPGETDRALLLEPPVSATAWSAALGRTDAALALVVNALPPRTMVVVVGLDVRGTVRHLAPVVVAGDGITASRLVSPSTGRADLVTLADLAPTALGSLGIPTPSAMVGRPLGFAVGHASLDRLRSDDAWARARDESAGAITDVLAALMFLVATLLVLGRDPSALTRAGRVLIAASAVLLAAVPLASPLTAALPLRAPAPVTFGIAFGVLTLAAAVIAAGVGWALRLGPRSVVAVLAGAGLVLLIADLLTGGHLQRSTLFGTSDAVAVRFHGLGNAGLGILAGGFLVVVAEVARRRRVPAAVVLAGGGVLVIVAVLPPFGAKVGAALTLIPVVGLLALLLDGRRVTIRTVMATAVAVVAVLGLALAVDLVAGRGHESHLGRLASSFAGGGARGGDTLLVTLARKASTALRVLATSTWTAPSVALAIAIVVVVRGAPARTALPAATRTIARVVLVLAVVGIALNDSGIFVAGLSLSLFGAYLLAALVEVASPAHADARPTTGEVVVVDRPPTVAR